MAKDEKKKTKSIKSAELEKRVLILENCLVTLTARFENLISRMNKARPVKGV